MKHGSDGFNQSSIAYNIELFSRKKIGNVIGLSGIWALRKDDDYFSPEWRKKISAGPVITNLIHDIDYLRFIFGEITEVSAFSSNNINNLLQIRIFETSLSKFLIALGIIFKDISEQGQHRLERGRNFFNGVLKKSKELDIFLKWGLVEVPTREGHSNTKQMVPFAAELFYERLK